MLAKKFRVDVVALKERRAVKQERTPYFVLKFFPNTLGQSQFGVIIPKKAVALASSRNYLKRVAFNFFNENRGQLDPSYDYLLIASNKTAGITGDKDAIVEQLQKLIND